MGGGKLSVKGLQIVAMGWGQEGWGKGGGVRGSKGVESIF